MAKYMYDLPGRLDFPVYGLGEHFAGRRWLAIWNDHQRLYTVTLGHGEPGDASNIFVETCAKTPEQESGDGHSLGPTGLGDVWLGSVVALSELAYPKDKKARNAFIRAESERPEIDEQTMAPILTPDWREVDVEVAGSSHPARERVVEQVRVVLIDLPDVAVSVVGTVAVLDLAFPLIDARNFLDRYE